VARTDIIQPVDLETQIISKLKCWKLKVALSGGAAASKKVTVLLTKAGWVLGSYDDLRLVLEGCSMDGLWTSQLTAAWNEQNALEVKQKKNPRLMRFGRRAGDILEPGATSFPKKSGKLSDREYSISSHSRRLSPDEKKAAIHSEDINTETARQLEVDKKKAASYADSTIESHHVVEDNLFEKLKLRKYHRVFEHGGAICVALNREFHQRYLSLKKWEREGFAKKRPSGGDIISGLTDIYDDLYSDSSVDELRTVSHLIIAAVACAVK
jgi:hypothetical protein